MRASLPAAPPGVDPDAVLGVLGVAPLVQFVLRGADGAAQVTTDAWDVDREEWFSTLAGPVDAGAWAHHEGGGNTWNRSCAECHATEVRRGFDGERWSTTWGDHGVTCEACHGAVEVTGEGHGPTPQRAAQRGWEEVCDSCHTRRTALTEAYRPGEPFLDHFVPSLVDGVHLSVEGHVVDEVFEGVPFWNARMHQAGVRCTGCHDPHSGSLRQTGDALCAGCHAGEPPHDLHQEPLACVDCHMPAATFMQRHERRDHALAVPDPVLALELGTSSACDRCHADRPATAEAYAAAYPARATAPDRQRRRLWGAVAAGDPSVVAAAASALSEGPGPHRATLAALAEPLAHHPALAAALVEALGDHDPLVRLAAAQTLGNVGRRDVLPVALADDRRAVRVAAALALGPAADGHRAGAERDAYLSLHQGHPDVQTQRASLAAERGDVAQARSLLDDAVASAPRHVGARRGRAVLRSAGGDAEGAVEDLQVAHAQRPADAEVRFLLGLALVATGDRDAAAVHLAEAADRHADAARNLGLLHAEAGRYAEAARALFQAEALTPRDVRVHVALAVVLRDWGRTAEARAAARHALEIDPEHPVALSLLREL